MTHGAAIFGPLGLTVTDWEKDFFRDSDPWGFILFARNIDTPDQVKRLTSDLRETVGRDAPVLIDQEGGRVQRMRSPHWREYMPPLDQADLAGPAGFYLRSRLIAQELHAVGIDVNCGPTCDIASDKTHPFLMNRCLGRDADTVIAHARAVVDGYIAGGVLPVIKHMPGHGTATVDSHLHLPTASVTLAEAETRDFAPFKALNDCALGMSAHIVFPEMGDAPATQNPAMIAYIREHIGFDGLLMSDDIGMEALSGDPASRSALSLQAGCDVVLHCNGSPADMQAVAAASGQMTAKAATRATRALGQRKAPDVIDIDAMIADLAALLG